MPESSKYLYHTGTGSSARYSKLRVSTHVNIWARRLKPSALLEDHPSNIPSYMQNLSLVLTGIIYRASLRPQLLNVECRKICALDA